MAHEGVDEGTRLERLKQQLAIAAVAGGFVAKSAVDSVLDWLGYHKTSGETVKHVNANMDHLKVVARHVEHMEVIVQKMVETAGHEEGREELIELYLHLTIAVEVLFDRVKQISLGLDQLGLHRHVTPHLVKAHHMQQQVHSLQTELHGSTELLMINIGSDIWKCPPSYVISAELDVAVMVHIPIARKDSYIYFYRYVSTPMMAPENKFRMLAMPRNKLLGINRDSHVAWEVSEESFQRCKSVGNGPRYCPSKSIQLTETVNTCLTWYLWRRFPGECYNTSRFE